MAEDMNITDREKKASRSIVKEKRSGTLEILNSSNESKIARIEINKEISGPKYAREDMARELIKHLSPYANRKISIIFSE